MIEVPTPTLTIHNVAVSTNEGSAANIVVRASENPKRTLRFNYTPTETNTTYLTPIDQDSSSKGSGTSRYVDLIFTQATPNSSDPWLATIAMATQQAVGLEGTISVQLVAGAGYTVGSPDTATVTVDDISIPELSIAYVETETLAGKDAKFEVTSDIPFVGNLNVAYIPLKSGGNFLDESDGTSGGPNTNSGVSRTVQLTFAQSGAVYKASLLVATLDDAGDTNGGQIAVTLQADPETVDTYSASTAPGNTATATVIKVPIPELTIAQTSRAVSTDEGTAASIVIRASENPKRTLRVYYTPIESGSSYLAPFSQDGIEKGSNVQRYVDLTFAQEGPNPRNSDPWLATISVATQADDSLRGRIVVGIQAGDGYTVSNTLADVTAQVTVNDVSIPALSIANANETLAGNNAEFIVTSSIPFTGTLNVAYTPEVSDGNFLNETTGTSGINANSGVDRFIDLSFSKVGDDHVSDHINDLKFCDSG